MSLKIGKALELILEGITIPIGESNKQLTLKTHYGDQFELNKWVGIQNASKRTKYPLAYYALNKDYKEANGWIRSKVMLILLTQGEYTELNGKRLVESYEKILYPLAEKIESELIKSNFVTLFGKYNTRFKRIDDPLMSISADDFTKLSSKGKSATTDVVDALVLEFEAEINTNCV